MKIHNVDKINLSKLAFDDEITGVFLKGKYTHHNIENDRMFLIFKKVKKEWLCLDMYLIGLDTLKKAINKYDLKILRNEKSISR